jgi:hypothetical protein
MTSCATTTSVLYNVVRLTYDIVRRQESRWALGTDVYSRYISGICTNLEYVRHIPDIRCYTDSRCPSRISFKFWHKDDILGYPSPEMSFPAAQPKRHLAQARHPSHASGTQKNTHCTVTSTQRRLTPWLGLRLAGDRDTHLEYVEPWPWQVCVFRQPVPKSCRKYCVQFRTTPTLRSGLILV